jgi:hypothetical protein
MVEAACDEVKNFTKTAAASGCLLPATTPAK